MSEATYEPVMPFVVCRDHGGPYGAKAFVAGYTAGHLDATLRAMKGTAGMVTMWVSPDLVPQLDLIAMHHGMALRAFESDESGEWVRVQVGADFLLSDRGEAHR